MRLVNKEFKRCKNQNNKKIDVDDDDDDPSKIRGEGRSELRLFGYPAWDDLWGWH